MRIVPALFPLFLTHVIGGVESEFEGYSGSLAESSLETEVEEECHGGDESCRRMGIDEPSLDERFDDDDDGRKNPGEECSDEKMNYCAMLVSKYPSREQACIELFDSMQVHCRKTCKLCGNIFAELDENDGHILHVVENVYSEQGQEISTQQGWDYNDRIDEYMYQQVFVDDSFASVRNDCKNRHELCTFWAAGGECETNPNFMNIECAPACFSCDQLSFETRCPFDPNEPTIWSKPGDLDRAFTRIVADPEFAKYNPQVLSQPKPRSSSKIFKGPWVVVLDEFLTPEECEVLQEFGALKGFERSEDLGELKFDGTFGSVTSESRTSTNAWCTDECWENSTTQAVHSRIEHLIQVPSANYEYLQLLKYEEGQFYGTHHDYIEHHLNRRSGPRIMTVFLYLNDVESGGGTNFPLLNNITVFPKKGRVLLWPSVLDEDPMRKDGRTNHQALPVKKGVKYGANAWVHQRDFKEPWKRNCHS